MVAADHLQLNSISVEAARTYYLSLKSLRNRLQFYNAVQDSGFYLQADEQMSAELKQKLQATVLPELPKVAKPKITTTPAMDEKEKKRRVSALLALACGSFCLTYLVVDTVPDLP
jgi:hypothetical protein